MPACQQPAGLQLDAALPAAALLAAGMQACVCRCMYMYMYMYVYISCNIVVDIAYNITPGDFIGILIENL